MNIDPNAPAYPCQPLNPQGIPHDELSPGIPIRLEIASRVMAGMLANPNTGKDRPNASRKELLEMTSSASLAFADALIEAHNGGQQISPYFEALHTARAQLARMGDMNDPRIDAVYKTIDEGMNKNH